MTLGEENLFIRRKTSAYHKNVCENIMYSHNFIGNLIQKDHCGGRVQIFYFLEIMELDDLPNFLINVPICI